MFSKLVRIRLKNSLHGPPALTASSSQNSISGFAVLSKVLVSNRTQECTQKYCTSLGNNGPFFCFMRICIVFCQKLQQFYCHYIWPFYFSFASYNGPLHLLFLVIFSSKQICIFTKMNFCNKM